MTYKGVYRGGVVVLEGDIDLQDGAIVDVNPTKKRAAKPGSQRKPSKKRSTKRQRKSSQSQDIPAFGLWKNRWPKSMSSAEVARQLREQASRRMR